MLSNTSQLLKDVLFTTEENINIFYNLKLFGAEMCFTETQQE